MDIKKLPLLISFFLIALLMACQQKESATVVSQKFIEPAFMDSTVKPGDDFYRFINGTWIKETEISATESQAGSFLDLYNSTKKNLRSILDETTKTKPAMGSIEQKVGDFYASGMDSTTIEKLGYEPVKPYLLQIDNLTDAKSIMQFEAGRHTERFNYLAGAYVGADEKNSAINIINFVQSGIGLPDKDYYFKTDAATLAIQKAYIVYIKKLFMLIGDDSVTAEKKAARIYSLEKQMAYSHRSNVDLRDPQLNYNKLAVTELDKKMPHIGWSSFLKALGASSDSVNIGQPAYYDKLNGLLKTTPTETWKAYYKFHILDAFATALSKDFVNAHFEYSGKALNGQQKIKSRWERMYAATDNYLGEALGQLYVKKHFTEDAKKRMLSLINNLEIAFQSRIENLDWMSDSTKQTAKGKLHTFLKKIGFPDKWKDYSDVTITKDAYIANIISCSKSLYTYDIKKVGKPVDKTEWGMSPPTINAYYNPTFNEIVFPAGILQFPFFDANADDAINYGAIGMVIGHEMTHGFDDQGAQYDKDGNLKNWWAPSDNEKFKEKSKLVIDQYNGFTVLDSIHVNGALTTGENMADIGGVAIAYDAFKMTKQGKDTTRIDGFTPDQRFFISLAQIWRSKYKDEITRQYINVDPHSPSEYRVNGPLMNFTPFYEAFQVQPGDKMYKAENERIKIW